MAFDDDGHPLLHEDFWDDWNEWDIEDAFDVIETAVAYIVNGSL